MEQPQRAGAKQRAEKVMTSVSRALEPLRIELFGSFRVSIGARVFEDSEWRLRKAKALVKLRPGSALRWG